MRPALASSPPRALGYLLIALFQTFAVTSVDLRGNRFSSALSQALVAALPQTQLQEVSQVPVQSIRLHKAPPRGCRRSECAAFWRAAVVSVLRTPCLFFCWAEAPHLDLTGRSLGPFELSLLLALLKGASSVGSVALNGNPDVPVQPFVQALLQIESIKSLRPDLLSAWKRRKTRVETAATSIPLRGWGGGTLASSRPSRCARSLCLLRS